MIICKAKDLKKILLILCAFFSTELSFAQIDERDGREYVQEVGSNTFKACYNFLEAKKQLFLSQQPDASLHIKVAGEEIAELEDPHDLVGSIGFEFYPGKAYKEIPSGTIMVFKGYKNGNVVLIKVDVENRSISLLQDFSEYLASDLVEGFKNLTIKDITNPIDGKIYCNVEMTSEETSIITLNHILQVDVTNGNLVNLTEDYITDPVDDPEVRNNFNNIDHFMIYGEDAYFIKTEDRPLDPHKYFDPYQKFLYKLQGGSISLLHTFEINELINELEGFVSNNQLVLVMQSSSPLHEIVYVKTEDSEVKAYTDGTQMAFADFFISEEHLTDARVYDGYSYFIDDSLVKLNPDGTQVSIPFPKDENAQPVSLQFIDNFDNNDDGLYFLGNAEYVSGISENLGKLWKYNDTGWTGYDVETTDKGLTSDGDHVYVSGLKPKDDSPDALNIVGIYELLDNNETELHWYLRTFTINLNIFDNNFYFQNYDKDILIVNPLLTIPHFDYLNQVSFGVAQDQIHSGDAVQFSDNTKGDVVSRTWVFENGTPSTSTEQYPVVRYEAEGSFNVELTVTFSDNSTKTTSLDNFITVNPSFTSECPEPNPVESGQVFGYADIGSGEDLGIIWECTIKEHGRLVYYPENTIASKPDEYYGEYELFYRPINAIEWTSLDVTGDQLSGFGQVILTGLEPKATYEVKIRTKCDEDLYSYFSDVSYLKTSAPIPILDYPSTSERGDIKIPYRNLNGFDRYTGVEVLYKHVRDPDNQWHTSYFDKGDPVIINVTRNGYYNYKLRYRYRPGEYSDYTMKKYAYVYLEGENGSTSDESDAELTFNLTDKPAGNQIQFTDQSGVNPVKWTWEFEGGYPSVSNEQNPEILYDNDGLFGVSLTVEDENGNSYSVSYDSIVAIITPVEIQKNIDNPTTKSLVKFSDNQPEGVQRMWYFEGGTPSVSDSISPEVTYSIAGAYDVSLIVTTANGPQEYRFEDYVQVESVSGIKADFALSNPNPSVGDSVVLLDHSKGNIISWSWLIGGGSPDHSVQQSPAVHWEEAGEFEVSLVVMDSLREYSYVSKIITVNPGSGDQGDNQAPAIAPQSFTIDEKSAVGSVVGLIEASDPDGDELTFSIRSGNVDEAFKIDEKADALIVNNSAAVDYTTSPEFTLTVEADDGKGLTASADIVITLKEVSEGGNAAPVVAAQTFTLTENAEKGTLVGKVKATDPNNDVLNYKITQGNAEDAFSINISSGQLSVKNSEALDYEINPVFTLLVKVTDGDLSSNVIITIELTDEEETITAVASDEIKDSIHLYPNPTQDYLKVEVPVKFLEGTLILYDLAGEKLASYVISERQQEIDMSRFSDGNYILKLQKKEVYVSFQVIKTN